MTENNTHEDEDDENGTEKRKVKDLSHTHPDTGEPFGSTGTFDRGTKAAEDETEAMADEATNDEEDHATDGGSRRPRRDRDGRRGERRTLGDLDHAPPDGHGAQEAYERGGESGAE